MKLRLLRFSFFIIIVVTILGCSNKSASFAPKSTFLKTAFGSDPQTVSATRCADFISSSMVSLLFDGLTRPSTTQDPKLSLAKKIEVSEDGKIYTFYLKKAFWTDGTPITARDFERSWKKALDPSNPSPCAYLFYCIENAENYLKGFCNDACVGIHCLSDEVLVIHLERPTAYFLSLTSFPSFYPTPKDFDPDQFFWKGNSNLWISSGPFTLSQAKFNDRIVLKKNFQFHNQDQIHLDGIDIKILKDETLGIHLFQKGDLDLLGGAFFPITFERLKKLPDPNVIHSIPSAGSTFLCFNTQSKLFSDLRIRQAIFSVIITDENLQAEIEHLHQIQPQSLLPPSLKEGFPQKESCKDKAILDPKKAFEKALASLNMDRKDFEKIKLYFRPSPLEKKIAQILQNTFEKKLGIKLKLEQTDGKTLASKLYMKDFDISLSSWIAQIHDPINILERFKHSKNAKNYPSWSLDSFGRYLELSFGNIEKKERGAYLSEAEDLLMNSASIVPLYHWNSPVLVSNKVGNFLSASCGYILLESLIIANE